MTETSSLFEDLKRTRDEIRLQIHLASMEARDEWNELETKWENFARKAQLKETAENLGEAAEELAGEIKAGYVKLKKALVEK